MDEGAGPIRHLGGQTHDCSPFRPRARRHRFRSRRCAGCRAGRRHRRCRRL